MGGIMNNYFFKIGVYILSTLLISAILNSCAAIPTPKKTWKRDTIDVGRCGFKSKVINGEIIVLSVKESSPAEKAGIIEGDIIISADGKRGSKEYFKSMNKKKKGDKVLFKVKRVNNYIDIEMEPQIVSLPVVALKLQEILSEDEKRKVNLAVFVTKVEMNIAASKTFDESARERWIENAKTQSLVSFERVVLRAFGDFENFSLIDRGRLNTIFDEINFGESGYVSDAARVKIGKLTGATHIIALEHSRYSSGRSYQDTATQRLIDVETGKILSVGIDRTE
jgi:membrane-associated protease RseP (regulator of RpoE activity)